MVTTCTARQAVEALMSRADTQLIDVREYAEYAGGHACGARLIPLGQVASRLGEIDKGRPVVILCKGGKRAGKAAEVLAGAGYEEVTVVEGGTEAWIAAGLPVEKAQRAPWALERQVRLAAGLLVLAGLFIPPWPWFSGLIGAGLVFAGLTNTCGMGMLISKMPWNRPGKAESGCCCDGKSCCGEGEKCECEEGEKGKACCCEGGKAGEEKKACCGG